jgi:putative two-component system response regulator
MFMKKPVILLVDDSPDMLSFVSGLLKESYQVKVANNGKKAIEISSKGDPLDLILLDIMMPDMDGYTALNLLRNIPATKSTPVIMLTGVDHNLNKKLAFELGAVGYITKPVNGADLLEQVEKALTGIK